MRISDIAFNNLRRRKGKTIFLITGLLIGVTTMVAVIATTSAMQTDIAQKMDAFGANLIVVPNSPDLSLSYGGVTVTSVSAADSELSEDDIARIRTIRNKANLRVIAPKLLGTADIEGKQTVLVGVIFAHEVKIKPWWQWKGDLPVIPATSGGGSSTCEEEISNGGRWIPPRVVLGSLAAQRLNKALDDPLRINGKEFKVSAILESTGAQEDFLVYADLREAQELLRKPGKLSLIEVSAWCTNCPIETIIAQVSQALPHARPFAVKAAIAAKLEALSIFTRFAVGLSVAVLIIGAIIVGVSMMSSIHERIREIGILRAVGFRRAHLMRMFLIEILAVSLTSGCLGFIMGTAVAQFISSRIAASSSIAAWDPLLALVAIGLATVMGTVGGFYPAIRASQLDPVEALRAL